MHITAGTLSSWPAWQAQLLLVAPNFAFELAKKKKFKIGSTFILWGYGADNLEPALKDMAALGYHSFETFGNVIDDWETKRGGFSQVVQKYGVPIVSAFCQTDVLDPSKRKAEMDEACPLVKTA